MVCTTKERPFLNRQRSETRGRASRTQNPPRIAHVCHGFQVAFYQPLSFALNSESKQENPKNPQGHYISCWVFGATTKPQRAFPELGMPFPSHYGMRHQLCRVCAESGDSWGRPCQGQDDGSLGAGTLLGPPACCYL